MKNELEQQKYCQEGLKEEEDEKYVVDNIIILQISHRRQLAEVTDEIFSSKTDNRLWLDRS